MTDRNLCSITHRGRATRYLTRVTTTTAGRTAKWLEVDDPDSEILAANEGACARTEARAVEWRARAWSSRAAASRTFSVPRSP